MKQATYTNKQIIAAGVQFLTDRKRVTPFAIRNILVGGNPARIKAVWEESQHTALEGQLVSPKAELLVEFSDALEVTKGSLDELASRMYGRAQEITESRVRESIMAARKAKETAEAEIAEAMEVVEHLDNENNRLLEDATNRERELGQRLEHSQHAEEQAKEAAAELRGRLMVLDVSVETNGCR